MALNRPDEGKQLTVDELIECNGNWYLAYVYNNYGDNVLMLLPMNELDHLSAEAYINNACITLCQGTFEEARMIDQWLADYPDTPFLTYVGNGDIAQGIENIDHKLRLYNGNWDTFTDDVDKFNEWRNVVYYVNVTENGDDDVAFNGYKSRIEEAKKLVDSMK